MVENYILSSAKKNTLGTKRYKFRQNKNEANLSMSAP
jgi:hypothetical protein